MQVKKEVVLEVVIDDNKICLSCDEAAPLGSLWDAVSQFRQFIFEQLEQQHVELQKDVAEEAEAEKPEEEA
jgi:hypothetical protein